MGEDQPLGSSRPARRRRPRITLAVCMALVACLAVPMAWVANHARTQGLALSANRQAGGFVIDGFQRSPDGMILVESTRSRRAGSAITSPTSSSRSIVPRSATPGWTT